MRIKIKLFSLINVLLNFIFKKFMFMMIWLIYVDCGSLECFNFIDYL